MRYNVATLLREPVGSTREHSVDEAVALDGAREPVHGRLLFVRTANGILVRAHLSLAVDERCARCLGGIRVPVSIEFEEEYVPTIDILTGTPFSVPEGLEDPYRIDEHHELDISEAVADYTVMSRPMAALCREDCPGICPDCGQEVTQGQEHHCRPEAVDERWSKLLDFHAR